MDALNITLMVFLAIMILAGIALIISIIFALRAVMNYYHLKGVFLQREKELADLKEENINKNVEYSNSLLEMVQVIVARIAVIRFRQFQDTHKIDPTIEGGIKVTKSHFVTLIGEIAREANDALNRDNFHLKDTYFTEDFYEKYIIGTSEILVKEMLSKIVDDTSDYI